MENFYQICVIKTKGHPVRNLEHEENNFGISGSVPFVYLVISVGFITESLIKKYI